MDRYVEKLVAHIRAATSTTAIPADELPFHMYWTEIAEPEESELTDDDFIIPFRDDDF
jgi:hypothetical protein